METKKQFKWFTIFDYEKEQVQEALRRLNISEQIRGEALTLAQFAALSNELEGK